MIFTFGMHLDGWRSCYPRTRLNEMTGGMLALLSQLELRLGLPHPETSHVRRVTRYREALEGAQTDHDCFYTASFNKDSLATAEVLLRWRDELVIGGWNGLKHATFSARLNDLAAAEALAAEEVRTCDGDRIHRISELLDGGAATPLTIHVTDERTALPHRLLQLLERLGATFDGRPVFPLAKPGTNLRRAQDALLGDSDSIQWNHDSDDTLVLCTAFSEMTLAQSAAGWISGLKNDAVVLATSPASALTAAIRGLDEPVAACSATSTERPILQALRLALRLRWQPLNPQHLLEFLVHPVCPLPAVLRRRLAAVVADKPGMGGTDWNAAVEKAREYARRRDLEHGSQEEKDIDARMRDWLLVERFDSIAGAPVGDLIETCERVREWALRRGAVEEKSGEAAQWQRLASTAREVGDLVAKRGRLPLAELDQFLSLAEGQGAARDRIITELSAVTILNDPAAVIEPVREIFWWHAEKPLAILPSLWTRSEREALASCGVNLVPAEAVINARHRADVLPLLAATERVRLFLPRLRAGEPVEHHPLLDELRALADAHVPVCDIDNRVTLGSWLPGLSAQPRKPLPPVRRWWKLPLPSHLHAREQESFSSLSLLVKQPFAWVLQYCARLEEGPVGSYSIAADSRQRGNLLHRVTEQLFDPACILDWKSASRDEFKRWIGSGWQALLETEGANLLMPGARSDAEQFRQQADRVIWQLIEQLRAAGVTQAEADVRPPDAPFRQKTRINGRIDLVVKRDGTPSTAVVDLKLGGNMDRRRELQENSYLQLAVYSYLLASENGGDWPRTSFFILADGTMLAPKEDGFFPNATEIDGKTTTPGARACWDDFLKVWDWRRAQLDSGLIEVPVVGSELAETDPVPPDARWAPDPEAARYDGFEALTGWRTDA